MAAKFTYKLRRFRELLDEIRDDLKPEDDKELLGELASVIEADLECLKEESEG